MRQPTALEKTVYGVAAHDVQVLFAEQGYEISGRLLNVVARFKDSTSLTNPEAIAAWRAGMRAEFPEVDWPDDYNVAPTNKSNAIRAILEALEVKGVSQAELDALELELEKLTTITEPEEEE